MHVTSSQNSQNTEQSPIIWTLALTRKICPINGATTQLFVATDSQSDCISLPADPNRRPEQHALNKIQIALSQLPWNAIPHELHCITPSLFQCLHGRADMKGLKVRRAPQSTRANNLLCAIERKQKSVIRWLPISNIARTPSL